MVFYLFWWSNVEFVRFSMLFLTFRGNLEIIRVVSSIANHPLILKLLSLGLPAKDYAVFGSGPMFAHGLKDLGHDLDLVARGEAWKMMLQSGQIDTSKGYPIATYFDGEIEAFDSWGPGKWDTDELIDTAEEIEGIRFVQLEKVLAWKKVMNRPKDVEHVRLIEEYLGKGK